MSEDTTVNELLARMLLKFENDDFSKNIRFSSSMDFDPAYPQIFLLTVKWYKEPEIIVGMLKGLYTASVQVCQSSEGAESVVKTTTKRKWAIARVIRFWLEHFPEDFRSISPLPNLVNEIQDAMTTSGDLNLADYISLDALPDEPKWFHHSLSTPLRRDLKVRRTSLGFDQTTALELAQIMCSLDYKLFRRIPLREFCLYAHAAKPTKETPRIEECIQLFNGVTIWIVCNILREFTIVKRADIIEKFIETTRHLHDLHCYNTLLAVVGGLNHFSVRRLNQTWAHVDKAKKDELTKWTNFFSSQMNYSTYRQTVIALNAGDFHIPVLGILLKDLVAVDSQAKDFSNAGMGVVNMPKYKLLWNLLSAMRQAQLTPPKTPPDIDHMRILRAAVNQSNMDDDALEELSCAREPRSRDSSTLSRSVVDQLPKFSEWAAGRQSSVDADTVSKHVRQMVDAVFRAYDTDHSGSISTEEFDAISSNFPFIEHFSVLDQDNDGTISYDELLSYFLSANTSLRERFTHLFAEHTFISSPVCVHCKGMMKGIVRQGVRCKDCGISCHKHCKDYVVVDCKKLKEKKKRGKGHSHAAVNPNGPELYCDDDISLKERLQRAEAARDALSAENSELLAKLAEANAKIHQLQSHIAVIRQHTIGFILEQMNTLNPSMTTPGTEV